MKVFFRFCWRREKSSVSAKHVITILKSQKNGILVSSQTSISYNLFHQNFHWEDDAYVCVCVSYIKFIRAMTNKNMLHYCSKNLLSKLFIQLYGRKPLKTCIFTTHKQEFHTYLNCVALGEEAHVVN
jgi:hypothetical protein